MILNKYEDKSDLTSEYGALFKDDKWVVRLWHPFAKSVNITIFDKNDQNTVVEKIEGKYNLPNWEWIITKDVDGYFYQFEITQEDGSMTTALDPYAKSMAAFNWEGKNTNKGKAAFVKFEYLSNYFKLNPINNPQPIMYEAHVRDLTALRSDVTKKGSYNAIVEANIGGHLNKMGFTHIQLLPIHNCYTLDENNETILGKGDGKGWDTNYNWGYDPHNYFSVNGWYSSKPSDPYSRINEFKNVVKHFHDNNVKVILDVVYNHMFHNSILDNVIPGYYFREGIKTKPVDQPAFATERKMARRIVIDSLVHFVKLYDVDGFRFDLSTFIDLQTLKELTAKLRSIKPHIVLHGEAWNWTDLEPTDSFNKSCVDNDVDFAYFNDTARNSIKGFDGHDKALDSGLINGNQGYFKAYLTSIIGNLKKPKVTNLDNQLLCQDAYDRFTDYPNIALNYAACHDGYTLWDKVNATIRGDKTRKIEAYRQALMMVNLLPGRVLHNQGSEYCYSKPLDTTGQDANVSVEIEDFIDIHNIGEKKIHANSYKTTDYTNGVRWTVDKFVEENVTQFLADLNKFRSSKTYLNSGSQNEIEKNYKFNHIDTDKLIIDFSIAPGLRIVHNFGETTYNTSLPSKVLFTSKLSSSKPNTVEPHSSIVFEENKA